MSTLLARIAAHARRQPDSVALVDGVARLSYQALNEEISCLSGMVNVGCVGLLLDNGIPWACLDLALRRAGRVCVPIPSFFSQQQIHHLIRDAGLGMVVTDTPERVNQLVADWSATSIEVAGQPIWLFRPVVVEQVGIGGTGLLPSGTTKITYTSGTTGQPKGVCLSGDVIENVAGTLAAALDAKPGDKSLSLLPLATLLENIGGLYAPLWTGAQAQIPSLVECGMAGSSGLAPAKLFGSLMRFMPTTIILVPQLLKVLVEGASVGQALPASLRFAAVGGAPVASSLIERARNLGIPAYQGYGLSEAASVVCLNLPGAEQMDSVGLPLANVRVGVNADGEVVVGGRLFLGYLGGGEMGDYTWATGDIGYLDTKGFLHLTGRKKTAYATAFGRNVAPEWVESELTSYPLIAQAAVFGEGQSSNVAVLVPRGTVSMALLEAAVATVNERLPDYARVARWMVADAPFSHLNGQANNSGALLRAAIATHYQRRIEQLYESEEINAIF